MEEGDTSIRGGTTERGGGTAWVKQWTVEPLTVHVHVHNNEHFCPHKGQYLGI